MGAIERGPCRGRMSTPCEPDPGTAFAGLWQDPRVSSLPAIAPILVAELLAEGERMPLDAHVIDHPDARVLVDTGMTELHPAVADLDPRLVPLSTQAFDLAGIDIVVNTHLHFDHCGGNHLFAGRPIYVQRRELDDARNEDDYTIREWVEPPGVRYVPVDGELELLPGLRLVPAPGHTRGLQLVVVETGGRPVSSAATWRFASASSTSRTPKASCACVHSTPSSSGSRTSTSRGGPAPCKRRRPASHGLATSLDALAAAFAAPGNREPRAVRSRRFRPVWPQTTIGRSR